MSKLLKPFKFGAGSSKSSNTSSDKASSKPSSPTLYEAGRCHFHRMLRKTKSASTRFVRRRSTDTQLDCSVSAASIPTSVSCRRMARSEDTKPRMPEPKNNNIYKQSVFLNNSSSDDSIASDYEDIYEDAVEEILPTRVHSMTLQELINDVQNALHLFFNNHYEKARERMEPCASSSIYHALGYSTLTFVRAICTYEQVDIAHAIQANKKAITICDNARKSYSIAEQFFGRLADYNRSSQLTENEMHADVCYAESLLISALLTLIQDESLTNFVRAAYTIRSCYNTYRYCKKLVREQDKAAGMTPNQILSGECEKISDNTAGIMTNTQRQFTSGVLLGVGTFALMISAMPSRILKMLEFVGLTGDKDLGLSYLIRSATTMQDTLRSPLASGILLCWHLHASFIFGNGDDCDMILVEKLLANLLQNYPNGAIGLYLKGRYHMVNARIDNAIETLEKSINVQNELIQLHHGCFWELMFCHLFARRFERSAYYAELLYQQNRWSKCTYSYLCGIFLHAIDSQLDVTQKNRMNDYFLDVPGLKQRIAGKSVPLEKFCVVKAERWKRRGYLSCAHYEIIYLYNGFRMITCDVNIIKPILAEVESLLEEENDPDERAICLLIRAMCLRSMQQPFKAEQCLIAITQMTKYLTDNLYCAPNAWMELAHLRYDQARYREALEFSSMAKSCVKNGYLLQSRLHFRVHSLDEKIERHMKNLPTIVMTPC